MSVSAPTKNGNMPKARSQRLGSADIAALLGLEDAFESPYSLWYRKVHGQEEIEESPAMRFGKFAEPFILSEYRLREDAGQIVKEQAHHEFKPWPVASATLDAIEIDASDSEPVDLEAKTTREFRWSELPAPYQAQMQWQLGVSGLNRGKAVVFYKPRTEIDVFVVDFDEKLFIRMVEVAREFWEKNVQGKVPPEVDGHEATTRTLKRFEATEGVIDIDPLAPVLEELGGVKAAIKELEGSKDALENRIKAYLGNFTIGTIGGKPAATWKSSTSSRIDTKALEAEHPEIAAKFRVETEARRFLITKAFSKKESD